MPDSEIEAITAMFTINGIDNRETIVLTSLKPIIICKA